MDRPASRPYAVLLLGPARASRCRPQSVVRYTAEGGRGVDIDKGIQRRSSLPPSEQFRNGARVLAVAATVWAIFCLIFMIYGNWGGRLIFGPGYLITLCYYWRGFGHPSLKATRWLWASSLLVQGVWFTFSAVATLSGHLGGGPSGLIMVGWWLLASAVSALGLWLDPGTPAAV